jgi:hypothetical protein
MFTGRDLVRFAWIGRPFRFAAALVMLLVFAACVWSPIDSKEFGDALRAAYPYWISMVVVGAGIILLLAGAK